jgi:hypothetical protein
MIDGENWLSYYYLLDGNTDMYKVRSNRLHPSIVAERVRLRPTAWQGGWICLRADIFGCLVDEYAPRPAGVVDVWTLPKLATQPFDVFPTSATKTSVNLHWQWGLGEGNSFADGRGNCTFTEWFVLACLMVEDS